MKTFFNFNYFSFVQKKRVIYQQGRSFNSQITDYFNSIIPQHKHGDLALVSTSTNIHYNLALENYIAENVDLKNRSIMLIWKSDKSIVYGRHQNPWVEISLNEAKLDLVRVARRYSGGGCVYHDLGNLNISFIVDRLKYDRTFNLNLIKSALDKLQLKKNYCVEISPRHDLFLREKNEFGEIKNSFKISGTASRLAKNYSYHHCTLLYESDITNMKFLRSSIRQDITSKATPSVRSECLNLKDVILEPSFTIDKLVHMLCEEYWRNHSGNWSIEHLFNYVDPGALVDMYRNSLQELESWDFQFGSTPKFQLEIPLSKYKLELIIEKGIIRNYQFKDLLSSSELCNISGALKNGLDHLIDTKLRLTDLVEVFNKCNLVKLDDDFKLILDYLNKNIL